MTDYAALCRDLREVVRLREAAMVARDAWRSAAKSKHMALAVESAKADEAWQYAAANLDAPALLELAEAAERGPVGYITQTKHGNEFAEVPITCPSATSIQPLYALTGPKEAK